MTNEYQYVHKACGKPVTCQRTVFGYFEFTCHDCALTVPDEDVDMVRVSQEPVRHCHKCGVQMCDALDVYWGDDYYAGKMCSPCRTKWERGQ